MQIKKCNKANTTFKHLLLVLLWYSMLVEYECRSTMRNSLFKLTNYATALEHYGPMTTHMKDATVTSEQNKQSLMTCTTPCLQEVGCRHVHSTTSTCYLLGSDALIGQDTAHTLQPSDLIYTRDPTGTNCRNVHFAETKIIIVNIKVLGTCF